MIFKYCDYCKMFSNFFINPNKKSINIENSKKVGKQASRVVDSSESKSFN